ncbi:MAG: hypothetical protein LV481_07750 [Methylacidiphilales bacterium]|nr:hypothetical protein [Candidatus Methylacidiphilales bacterium]
MSDSRLILHIKGTENQTTELPKNVVRAGIAQGQISRSQLIWSVAHNAWKQVRELPQLLPSQKLAPAPAPRVGTVSLPKRAKIAQGQTGPVPKVVARASKGGTPVAVRPVIHAAPETDLLVGQERGFRFMKWICIILTVLILAAVGVNYLLVDQPLVSRMSQTTYANVPVYAHLGAFVQPDALIIHVPVSSAVTSANLVDFLQVLAHSTPKAPGGGNTFDDVSLTTGWAGHYSFTGYAWKEFGDMADANEEQKQAFLLDQLKDTSGQSLVSSEGALEPAAQQAERDKVWAEFVAYFTQ